MTKINIRALAEAGLFALVRRTAVPAARWFAEKAGFRLIELPVVKTAYIGFGVTFAALLWVKASGEKLSDYGLRPLSGAWKTVGAGILATAIYLAYAILAEPHVDSFVTHYLGGSAGQAAQNFAEVTGDLPLFLFALPFIWLFAAFGEEFFYRGFLMTKIARGLGEGRLAWIFAVILQAVLFGLAHSYQGAVGMVGTGIVGLIYGAVTLAFARSILPAIIAHGAVDTLGFTLLYLGMLEA